MNRCHVYHDRKAGWQEHEVAAHIVSTNRKQKGMLVLSLLAFRILSVEPQPMRWSHPHGKRHTSTFRIVTNPKE